MADVTTNGFVETEIGLLPGDWEVRKLGESCTLATGGTPSRKVSEYWNGGIPWVKTGEVKYTTIKKTEESISKLGLENSAAKVYPAGTLLVAMYGQGVTRGRASILGIDAAINQACAAITVSDQVRSDFLFFALMAHYERIRELGHGANQRNLNMQLLRGVEMPVPPVAEQRTIAGVLRTVRRAKEATEKVIAAARQLKQSLMRHLFTYGPVPLQQADQVDLQETEIGEIPAKWQLRPIGEVAQLISGGTPSKKRPEFWNGKIPWASPKDMKRPRLWDVKDHITQAGLDDGSRLAPVGAVFIVIRGMILAKDLPVAKVMAPMAFNQDMKAIIPKESVDSDFLLYCLNYFKPAMLPNIGTSAHGTRRIGTSAISDFLIPVPPIEVQKRIVTALMSLDEKIDSEQSRFSGMSDVFGATLHELMTGQRRVHDLDLQLAEEDGA